MNRHTMFVKMSPSSQFRRDTDDERPSGTAAHFNFNEENFKSGASLND